MHDQHDDDKLILWKMTTAIGNAPEYSDMVYAHNDLAGFVMQVACWLVTCGINEEDNSLRQKQLRKDAFLRKATILRQMSLLLMLIAFRSTRWYNENGSSMGRAVGSSARGERIDSGRLVLVKMA